MTKRLIAAASVAALLGLAACGDRSDVSPPTVGQQMDAAADRTASSSTTESMEARQSTADATGTPGGGTTTASGSASDSSSTTTASNDGTTPAFDTSVMGAVGAVKEATIAAGTGLGEKIDDAQIVTRLNMGFAADKDLSAMKIDVDSKEGMVTLSGLVPNAGAKKRAEAMARTTRDVKTVNNQLAVKAG